MEKRVYLSSPTTHEEEREFVKEAFDTNWVAPLGPHVDAFEKEICELTGASHGAALSSGTAAIHLAVRLLGIEEGDIVFSQSLTFSASCNPVVYEKGKLVFIDSERETWNMDPRALEKAYELYPNPKAVIFVHLYGTPAKTRELMEICRAHNTPVIEDAAESLGAFYEGRHTGTFGDFGIYSFNGNKIVTTSGGGMLVSDNEKAITKARFLATQARDPARHYQHSEVGYNYRMSNVVAGIGRGQLKHLTEHVTRKKALYEQYKEAFADIEELHMNPFLPESDPNFWLSCVTLEKTDPLRVMEALDEGNIECRPIWKPMHLQPVFAVTGFVTIEGDGRKSAIESNRPGSVAEDIFLHGLCLPSDIKNTPEDMERIIGIVRRALGR